MSGFSIHRIEEIDKPSIHIDEIDERKFGCLSFYIKSKDNKTLDEVSFFFNDIDLMKDQITKLSKELLRLVKTL